LEVRAEARRRQILDAARACFGARGFHAATMAEIAATADLSVGQIYRFFENKEAIIEAITDLQLELLETAVSEVEGRDAAARTIRMLLAMGCEKFTRPGEAALFLEVTAEASRNPRIAAMVREHDRRMLQAITGLLAKARDPGATEEAECRAQMMSLVFAGLAVRAIRNPEFLRDQVDGLTQSLLAGLLGEGKAGCG
jgi:AcrR family transcriptional regulator